VPEVNYIKRLEAAPKVKTRILALGSPGASAKAVREFAQSLKLEAAHATQAQDGTSFSVTAGQHVVTMFKASGALRYQDRSRWQVDDGKANLKISDAEAEKRALSLISAHKLAPAREFKLLKVTRLTVGEASADAQRASERVIDVGVAFQRTVGGVPVDGPGGKLVVYMDHNGELTGFDKIWRPVAKVRAAVKALQPPKAAEEDLLRYWGKETGRIDVVDMRFGYLEFGYQARQAVLQPAYVMLLRVVSPNQRPDGGEIAIGSVHVFAAATNAVGRLMPPPKKIVRQAARKAS
jgi:hypothetical protein